MTGIGLSRLICPRATAASMSGTAQRMSSQPPSASPRIWVRVVDTSLESVEHIDCTAQGASPPTSTEPIFNCRVSFFIAKHTRQVRRKNQGLRADNAIEMICMILKQFSGPESCAQKNEQRREIPPPPLFTDLLMKSRYRSKVQTQEVPDAYGPD